MAGSIPVGWCMATAAVARLGVGQSGVRGFQLLLHPVHGQYDWCISGLKFPFWGCMFAVMSRNGEKFAVCWYSTGWFGVVVAMPHFVLSRPYKFFCRASVISGRRMHVNCERGSDVRRNLSIHRLQYFATALAVGCRGTQKFGRQVQVSESSDAELAELGSLSSGLQRHCVPRREVRMEMQKLRRISRSYPHPYGSRVMAQRSSQVLLKLS